MRHSVAVILGLALIAEAREPTPFQHECAQLDRIAETGGDPLRASVALEVLQRIAEARMNDAPPDIEAQLDLSPGELRGSNWTYYSVRVCAFRAIGRLGSGEALTYLQNLKRTDLLPDGTGQIWPAAQIGLHEALLLRLPDEVAKVKFLEDTLTLPHDRWSNSQVSSWAVDELCNRGSARSLGAISASIRSRDPSSRGEEDIAFCVSRIDVVSRSSDRVQALGGCLSVANGPYEPRLIRWAIYQLRDMKSAWADAELKRYSDEICGLPPGPLSVEWDRIRGAFSSGCIVRPCPPASTQVR